MTIREDKVKILIIGAAGMVGRKLAEKLAKNGTLGGKQITSMTLYDVVSPEVPAAPFEIEALTGDLPAAGETDKLVVGRPDVIFHLAAIVSGEAELDFRQGLPDQSRWDPSSVRFRTCGAIQSTYRLHEFNRSFRCAVPGSDL